MEGNSKQINVFNIFSELKKAEDKVNERMDQLAAMSEAFIAEIIKSRKNKKRGRPPSNLTVNNSTVSETTATGRPRRAAAQAAIESNRLNLHLPLKLRRPSVVTEDGIYRPPPPPPASSLKSLRKTKKRTTNLSTLTVVSEVSTQPVAQFCAENFAVKPCSVNLEVLSLENISPKKPRIVLNRQDSILETGRLLENERRSSPQPCSSKINSPSTTLLPSKPDDFLESNLKEIEVDGDLPAGNSSKNKKTRGRKKGTTSKKATAKGKKNRAEDKLTPDVTIPTSIESNEEGFKSSEATQLEEALPQVVGTCASTETDGRTSPEHSPKQDSNKSISRKRKSTLEKNVEEEEELSPTNNSFKNKKSKTVSLKPDSLELRIENSSRITESKTASIKPDKLEERLAENSTRSRKTKTISLIKPVEPECEVPLASSSLILSKVPNTIDDDEVAIKDTTQRQEADEDNKIIGSNDREDIPRDVVVKAVEPTKVVPQEGMSKPEVDQGNTRMTRTKTRELMKDQSNKNETPQDLISNSEYNPSKKLKSEPLGKENKKLNIKQYQFLSADKKSNFTPLFSFNTPATTSKITGLMSSHGPPGSARGDFMNKEYDKMLKEDLVVRKKEEQNKQVSEKIRKKRELKMEKVIAHKLAVEKEKQEQIAKMERERIEKEKQIIAEKERRKEEILLKKQLKQQKLQEAEERRLKEEQARLARLKELEEEQKRQAELRLKQEEEAEKLRQQRLAEDRLREVQEAQKKAKLLKAKEAVAKAAEEYDMTPLRHERVPLPPKCPDDYGISDADVDDSSDDESKPKKIIPVWAKRGVRERSVYFQSLLNADIVAQLLPIASQTPSVNDLFSEADPIRRTSSAYWPTP